MLYVPDEKGASGVGADVRVANVPAWRGGTGSASAGSAAAVGTAGAFGTADAGIGCRGDLIDAEFFEEFVEGDAGDADSRKVWMRMKSSSWVPCGLGVRPGGTR